jgi:hypothetical protein
MGTSSKVVRGQAISDSAHTETLLQFGSALNSRTKRKFKKRESMLPDIMASETFGVQCAWCGVEIQRSLVADSHGICLLCFNKLVEEIRSKRTPRLDEEDENSLVVVYAASNKP